MTGAFGSRARVHVGSRREQQVDLGAAAQRELEELHAPAVPEVGHGHAVLGELRVEEERAERRLDLQNQ